MMGGAALEPRSLTQDSRPRADRVPACRPFLMRKRTIERMNVAVSEYQSGKTLYQVAEILKCSHTAICYLLKSAGVSRRRPGHPRGPIPRLIERNNQIREARQRGESQQAIADRYGITRQAVSLVDVGRKSRSYRTVIPNRLQDSGG